jgi:DNA-binding response OmpR family regulator
VRAGASDAPRTTGVRIRRRRPVVPPEKTKNPEVIIVEDDIELARMLQFALRSFDYSVKVFTSGPQALRALLRLPLTGPPRIVLLADDLPGLDGQTLNEQLQEARPDRFIVAILSVRMSDIDHIRALRAGAVEYILKPISIPVLIAKVEVWTRRWIKP